MSIMDDPLAAHPFCMAEPVRPTPAPAVVEAALRTALAWALDTDADARMILRRCPPLVLAHGVLQASDRRTSWIVAISATAIGIQRVDTIAGATVARSVRLPAHLKATS